MKRNILVVVMSLSFFYAQSQSYWAKTIQLSNENDEAYRTKNFADSSGNLYVLNHLDDADDTLLTVSKFNQGGNLLWSYYYIIDLPGIDISYLIKSKDGLPSILLYYNDYNFNCILSLIKLDIQGNITQNKSYCIHKKVNLNGMISTTDSGYLAYGEIRNSGYNAAYVIKFDSLFNLEWTYRQKVDSNSNSARCAIETASDYFLGGYYSLQKSQIQGRPYLLKLNKNGHAVKAKIISNETWAYCGGIAQLTNNHLFTFIPADLSSKTVFTELDLNLNVISQNETSSQLDFFGMTSTDSLIYADFWDNSIFPKRRRSAIFDKSGNFLVGIDNSNYDVNEIIPDKGSSFFLRSWPGWFENYFDIYKADTLINDSSCISKFYQFDLMPSSLFDTLVPAPQLSNQPADTIVNSSKAINTITTTDLCISLLLNEQSSQNFNFFPNPTSASINIVLNKASAISIINLLGEVIVFKNSSFNASRSVELDVSFLSSGIYFIKAGTEVRKFIKL